jgi:hypothetical protein
MPSAISAGGRVARRAASAARRWALAAFSAAASFFTMLGKQRGAQGQANGNLEMFSVHFMPTPKATNAPSFMFSAATEKRIGHIWLAVFRSIVSPTAITFFPISALISESFAEQKSCTSLMRTLPSLPPSFSQFSW